ncbi:F-box/kelch-repeat protein At1g57790-like [Macadamia integrifolia]|uniref:F-box/kelch-repeat protein At1g57790-like n=1 Tax=Macadamia integrifolia TaxID=60698 RepID=UPI001C5015B9|nr:F-box/kelch-repeat protein At1g57790-like [Macadamia integrifolia]XP_042490385.1 F-box/kelch-repeat protein At1g57790-like [Macadamia integrifolia]XP_042490386.1 F-box/kelch-repeat protein At1g57790-like [Macadamia integrifolia]
MEEGRSFDEEYTGGSSASAAILLDSSDHDLKKEEEEIKNELESKETDKWSWGLPNDILEMILERLAFPDNLRFAAVCVPWKRVSVKRRQIPRYPWVMFSYTRQTKDFSLFSLLESRVYHINIPWIEAGQCLGSCQGWILASNPDPKHCFLFNPFSREAPIVELPYLNFWAGKNLYCWHSQNFFHKVILSSSPTDPDCLVIAISDSYGLAYCKIGDNQWVIFKDIEEDDFGEDVVFYNGQVYALSENDHQLMVLDMKDPDLSGDEDFDPYLSQEEIFALYPRKEDISVCPFMEILDQELLFNDSSFFHTYLVQSEGSLLLVSRIYKHATVNLDDRDFFTWCECGRKMFSRRHLQTVRFLVYKLECNPESSGDSTFRYNWVKQSRLGDNQVLFLGRSFCQSLSTVECPGLKGNTIYFTDDGKIVLNPPQPRDMGIYHLHDGQIEPLLPFDSSQFNGLPFWIIPSV